MYVVAAMLNIDTGNWGLLAETTNHHQTVTHLSSSTGRSLSRLWIDPYRSAAYTFVVNIFFFFPPSYEYLILCPMVITLYSENTVRIDVARFNACDRCLRSVFRVPYAQEEEKSEMSTPRHWRCNSCQGAAHMITKHIEQSALYDPVNDVNLTAPRKLTEAEVIDAVEKTCRDKEIWKSYGSIGLKTGINFFWGPGIEPPPVDEQVEDKHHTTTHGQIMVFRMQQMCAELIGILPEEEWYADYVLKNRSATKAVCHKKGQMCKKYPTQKYIDEYEAPERPSGLFAPAGGQQQQPQQKKKAAKKEAEKKKEAAGNKGRKKKKKKEEEEEL